MFQLGVVRVCASGWDRIYPTLTPSSPGITAPSRRYPSSKQTRDRRTRISGSKKHLLCVPWGDIGLLLYAYSQINKVVNTRMPCTNKEEKYVVGFFMIYM